MGRAGAQPGLAFPFFQWGRRAAEPCPVPGEQPGLHGAVWPLDSFFLQTTGFGGRGSGDSTESASPDLELCGLFLEAPIPYLASGA